MYWKTPLQATFLLPFLYSTVTAQVACNNSPQLCNRPYSNITHLGAHNSPFLRDESTSFSTSGNQYFDTITQLEAGVRLLTAQVHKLNNTEGNQAWHLCHSSCDLLDAGTLQDWLSKIKTWMDSNPNDVVTLVLVNSDDATPQDLGPLFQLSGIDKYAYTPTSSPPSNGVWPTLNALIQANKRLITFVASITPSPQFPYLLDEFSFVFENNFENESPTDFSCTPNRPSGLGTPEQALATGRMFLMNHFLYQAQIFGIQTPDEENVNVTNAQSGRGALGTQLRNCATQQGGRPPTFVIVDFFNVGPAVASVDAVNGVQGSVVGRRTLTDKVVMGSTSGVEGSVVKGKGSLVAVVVAVVVLVGLGV
ncbi:uncharacterized protein EI97DRAFT_426474 [Westerdykella ornata]|uniref:PLC-like phosphodiesterase n=1 Tax=Westerdykella ornata TaxID=318751 RepID=A0A6A6J8M6_WESOR|nr:uncharacterized protein EI97DRAFT_426474 [Westerdykella ornata]KAF2272358.1 hypothetical protein EI97DRAFT_426474 [Westerdykella ornata]